MNNDRRIRELKAQRDSLLYPARKLRTVFDNISHVNKLDEKLAEELANGLKDLRMAVIRLESEVATAGLIKPTKGGAADEYTTTDRGAAWVEMICRTPYPFTKEIWADPRTGEEVVR